MLNPLRLLLAFLLLLIPSTAMGATLPLLTATLTAPRGRYGVVLGSLYGWNTLGAVAGVVGTELVLLAAVGVRRSALTAAALSLVAALAAGSTSQRSVRKPTARARVGPPHVSGRAWLIAAFLSGFWLLALEVVWFRLLLLVIVGHSTAFALMLGIVLAGMAMGGLVASRWLRATPTAYRFAVIVAFAAAVSCVLCYRAFPAVIGSFDARAIERPAAILQVGVPLMFPVSVLSGLFFTLVGAGVRASRATDAHATGTLTLANTAGGALGALLGGFVLLPWFGIERSIAGLAAVYAANGLVLIRKARPGEVVTIVAGSAWRRRSSGSRRSMRCWPMPSRWPTRSTSRAGT